MYFPEKTSVLGFFPQLNLLPESMKVTGQESCLQLLEQQYIVETGTQILALCKEVLTALSLLR